MPPLVTDVFGVTELVQVIDPAIGVWENAKIVAFPSFRSVNVKFTNWSASKAGLPNVEVPPYAPSRSQWPIRKPIVEPIVRCKRNRSNKVSQGGHVPNAERKVRYETISDAGPSFADPTDLPSLTELLNQQRSNRQRISSTTYSAIDSWLLPMSIHRRL